MKVGIFQSWVSLVQMGSFSDQNTKTTHRNSYLIIGNTAVIT